MRTDEKVIEVEHLIAGYRSGRKKTTAVNDLSFDIWRGECVGFIGPNGAGKSTTIKVLMGFMFPASGSARLFGAPAGSMESRRHIGYLPEVSLYYPFMRARELLELYGGLQGMGRAQLKERIPTLLKLVGLENQGESLLRNFSKGMQQRLGIAQALIADPDLFIFDELSAGLDPLGRYDLRGVLLDLKRRGKTIFFSSHELNEVESLCDRVIMIHQGRKIAESAVTDLVEPLSQYEIEFEAADEAAARQWIAGRPLERRGASFVTAASSIADFSATLSQLISAGAKVIRTSARHDSLEARFMEMIRPSVKTDA
ncbi:MAG: ABC transporter ATP-binding protein [Candidatus Sumerlaeota bacterium]|nr:ABC transporter ATP-binding protein [Candidatus Sumerlaeota bacterium]